MMKIVEGFSACVFLINCAYVISNHSPVEGLWCPTDIPCGVTSTDPQCEYRSNITCPSGQGCCDFRYNGKRFVKCVNLSEVPTDCIDNQLLYPYGMTSLKHGEAVSKCYSGCSCYNGDVRCTEKVCLGDVMHSFFLCEKPCESVRYFVIRAVRISLTFGIPLIAGIACIWPCFRYFRKHYKRGRRGERNTHTKGDNPPSYKKAVRMPISISETIKEDAASPPTYDEAVTIE